MRRRLRTIVRSVPGVSRAARAVRRLVRSPRSVFDNAYERLYEDHASSVTDDLAVGGGGGEFEVMGFAELAILRHEGLAAHHTLIDFGCGTGRLAVKAIPFLTSGSYVGIDVSDSMLRSASVRVAAIPRSSCRVSLVKETRTRFPCADATADFICAFSVFTHLEHEDTYLYLKDARRVVKPGGRFVLSCLPMELAFARKIFLDEAKFDLLGRWSRVRCITTSAEMMNEIARLAGWDPLRWFKGDETIATADGPVCLGQSVCVLAPAPPA